MTRCYARHVRLVRPARWRRVLVVVACLAAGPPAGACSSFESTPEAPNDDGGEGGDDLTEGGDASAAPDVTPGAPADASADAGLDARCSAATKFGAPVFVTGIDVGAQELSALLTPDELGIVFASTRGGTYDKLYSASRTSVTAAFVDAQALPGLTGMVDDYWAASAPWTSGTLYFCSTRPSNTIDSIFATSVNDAGTYAPPQQVPALVNAQQLCHVHAARHAKELWMSGSIANGNIYRAPLQADGGFAPPTPVSELNTNARDFIPVLSDDGLVVYWASTRTDRNLGFADIWVATRTDPDGGFGGLHNVEELNSTADDFPAWLSPDECRLYLVSGRSGMRHQLFVATRTP